MPGLMEVSFLHLVGADLTPQHLPNELEIGLQIIRMSDSLEIGGTQFLLIIPNNLAHRRIYVNPATVQSNQGHSNCHLVEGAPEIRNPPQRCVLCDRTRGSPTSRFRRASLIVRNKAFHKDLQASDNR